MKIGILGAGSVGLGIAVTLTKAGADVTVRARGSSLAALQSGGIRVSGVLGDHIILPRDFRIEDAAAPGIDLDLLIVTTKTYEVAPALASFKVGGKTPALLLLQNGWGSAEEAKKIMPPGAALFSASVMVGLERLSPNEVRINAYADAVRAGSLFGDDAKQLTPLFDISKKGFIPFVPEPAIEPVLLGKLLYNICLNPLGALLRCTYGDLLTGEHTLDLMVRLAEEGIRTLARARGFTRFASGKDYIHGDIVAKWLPKVGKHRSSMLQDLESGRRTEIDYLNGAVAAMGRHNGIATPCNDTIISLVRAAEARKPS